MRAHEAHAHEAYCPEADEHCAVFTIRHLLPHGKYENLASSYEKTCCLYPPRFRDSFKEIPPKWDIRFFSLSVPVTVDNLGSGRFNLS
jgi:hypothetical protein